MSRRGAALLTVLWLVAALSGAAAVTLSLGRLGADTTRNRVLLARSEWAREACGEILLARYAERGKVVETDTVDLGRGTWCLALAEENGARLDINRITPEVLRNVLRDEALSDAVLDWIDADDEPRPRGGEAAWYRGERRRVPRNGPLASIAELAYVRGFDPPRTRRLEALLTAHGGSVDVNRAPAEVLSALPGMTPEGVATIVARRPRRIESADEMIDALSGGARATLLARFQDFTAMAAFAPSIVVVRLEGGVRGTSITGRGWLTVVPAPGRLAVVRREAE